MRILEIVLVGLMSIQLAILLFGLFRDKKQRMVYMILCSAALLAHLVFEGYRWQMVPAYLLFLILLIIQFRDKELKKAVRIIQASLLVFLLILTMFLPSALPVLHFKATGDYQVGVANYQLTDKKRDEILTENKDDFREISLRVFYPASLEKKGSYAYIPDYEKVKHTYQKKIGWPAFLLDYLKLFKLDATEGATPFKDKQFPIVFYSHGLTNNYTEAQGRLLKIASHGYVIVAINHTYSSDFAILSDGKVVGYKALSQLGDPIDKVDSVKTIIANQWVDDVKFAMNEMAKTQLSKTIDFNNTGLLGFSAGGTMATLGSYRIENVKAAVNLDGTPRGIDLGKSAPSPQLFMFSEPEHFSDAQIAGWGITREDIEAPVRLINERSHAIVNKAPVGSEIIRIPDSKHSNFTDYPLLSPLSYYLGFGGKIDSEECYQLINSKVLNFLDLHLKGKN